MNPLETLTITPATTGRDLFGALSEEETACIEGIIGEAFFGMMMNAPVMQSASNPAAAPIFGCISEENLILIGVAFMEAQAGGWEESTRRCVTDVGREHPNAVYMRLGIGDATANASETNEYSVAIYQCKTNEEKRDFTLSLWVGVDRNAKATGADIVGLLSEAELACVMEDLSEEEMAAVAAARPLEAVTIANRVQHCIEPETNVEIFVSGLEWGLGEFSEKSADCLREFVREHPQYMELVQSGIENMRTMDAGEFVSITDAGLGPYGCMTNDEIQRMQMAFNEAVATATQ